MIRITGLFVALVISSQVFAYQANLWESPADTPYNVFYCAHGVANYVDSCDLEALEDHVYANQQQNGYSQKYDLDNDNDNDTDDIVCWLSHFNVMQGDAKVDRRIDFADYQAVFDNYGKYEKRWYRGNFHLGYTDKTNGIGGTWILAILGIEQKKDYIDCHDYWCYALAALTEWVGSPYYHTHWPCFGWQIWGVDDNYDVQLQGFYPCVLPEIEVDSDHDGTVNLYDAQTPIAAIRQNFDMLWKYCYAEFTSLTIFSPPYGFHSTATWLPGGCPPQMDYIEQCAAHTIYKGMRPGDVDFDGDIDTADMAFLMAGGEYEDGIEDNSVYSEGDVNMDADFTSDDYVLIYGGMLMQGGGATLTESLWGIKSVEEMTKEEAWLLLEGLDWLQTGMMDVEAE